MSHGKRVIARSYRNCWKHFTLSPPNWSKLELSCGLTQSELHLLEDDANKLANGQFVSLNFLDLFYIPNTKIQPDISYQLCMPVAWWYIIINSLHRRSLFFPIPGRNCHGPSSPLLPPPFFLLPDTKKCQKRRGTQWWINVGFWPADPLPLRDGGISRVVMFRWWWWRWKWQICLTRRRSVYAGWSYIKSVCIVGSARRAGKVVALLPCGVLLSRSPLPCSSLW